MRCPIFRTVDLRVGGSSDADAVLSAKRRSDIQEGTTTALTIKTPRPSLSVWKEDLHTEEIREATSALISSELKQIFCAFQRFIPDDVILLSKVQFTRENSHYSSIKNNVFALFTILMPGVLDVPAETSSPSDGNDVKPSLRSSSLGTIFSQRLHQEHYDVYVSFYEHIIQSPLYHQRLIWQLDCN